MTEKLRVERDWQAWDGKAVVRLLPVEEQKAPDRARAVQSIRALSKRLNIRTRRSLRSLVEEGRD